ncbi:heterocyst formation ABC transporter subunit HepA [Acaryochloris sp. CCMEE 5410]|uniref:heterocyst formation ABC transporter subunit HepA n=1 Tax=Acaryochloris sp. CCMEE 5410 TaxID=310037 RepID=UPI0002FFEB1A|nr:heterocyst formation ABC transporter subunit HepA [Acaryochloris sp. CCMEE 5410]
MIRNVLKATHLWQSHGLILKELRHYRLLLIAALFFSFVSAISAALSIGLISALLQGLTSPYNSPLQTGIGWIDIHLLGIQTSANQRIYRLAALTLVISWLQIASAYWGQLSFRLTALGLVNRLRKKLFDQLKRLSLSYYLSSSAGALTTTLTSEVNQIQQALMTVAQMITQLSLILGYGISMFVLSWQLSLAMLLITCTLSWGLQNLQRQVRAASFGVPEANKRLTEIALEFIYGIRTVHAHNSQAYEQQRYNQAADQALSISQQMTRSMLRVQPIARGIASSLLILIITVSYSILIAGGTLQASTLLAFLFVVYRTLPLVSQLSDSRVNLISLQGSLENVSELLTRNHKPYLSDGTFPFAGLQLSIEFVHVSFGYTSGHWVLKDINLSLRKNQMTALVGASGAGKSTIVDLIPRFFDPMVGQILVDGMDLRQLQLDTLRDRMAIVSQDTYIFNASVRDNIAYGLSNITEERVWQAAEQANALSFIQEMPEGLNTPLGERGIRLSGGQRQRIAIARALLRNPEILILDEATSALDSITEQLIQESLMTLVEGRTVIAIAHRLSTIANADQVVVLDQGQIVEQGTYQALLDQRGQLWQFHQMQFKQPSRV